MWSKSVMCYPRVYCRVWISGVGSISKESITEKATCSKSCTDSGVIEETIYEATVVVEAFIALAADSAGAVPAGILEPVDVSEGEGAKS